MDRSSVVSLDAFEASLRGTITTWFLKDETPAHGAGFTDQAYTESPPNQRRILLTAPSTSQAWSVVDTWDVIYRVGSIQDWGLALAILQNQNLPYVACVAPELKPPAAFFQKLTAKPNPRMTLILYSVLGEGTFVANPFVSSYFFPCISPVDTVQVEHMERSLRTLVGNTSFTLKDTLKDIYSAQAGLTVSKVGYSAYHVFWYYATAAVRSKTPLLELIQAFMGQA
jgi:hypothetical protein